MIHEKIDISIPGYDEIGQLYTYIIDNSIHMRINQKRPIILICPGGGYCMTSDREAEPVAIQYLSRGYHAAILRYSVNPAEYPVALLQLAASVKYLKENAEKYHIDKNKIILQGFSAGGHLAGCLGVLWNSTELKNAFRIATDELKPRAMILSYPVITSGEFAHKDSFVNLLGKRYEKLKEELSLEKRVNQDTVPTFLWHTTDDELVPVENSLLLFEALKRAGVPVELHIYQHGRHGLSLANYETSEENGNMIQKECQSWIELVFTWLKQFE